MKRLTLRCICGESQVFRGSSLDEIIKAIDDSGWQDTPGDDEHDLCPECLKDAR